MGAIQFRCIKKAPSVKEVIEAQKNKKSISFSVPDLQEEDISCSEISNFVEKEGENKDFFSFSGSFNIGHRKYNFNAICHKKSHEGYIEYNEVNLFSI